MWRGVVKGDWNPHDREIPLRIEVPRNRSRNSKKCCKQVGCAINKERYTAWQRGPGTSPYALLVLQMVVPNGTVKDSYLPTLPPSFRFVV
jgi:hypothetical protein